MKPRDPMLYDDEYQGPRWTYGLTYRPAGFANIPDGFIVFSAREHPDYRFGTVDYPFAIPEARAKQMDLTLVKAPE